MIPPKPPNPMLGLPPDPHRNRDPGTNPSRSRHPAITTGRVPGMPSHGITEHLLDKHLPLGDEQALR
jgi:hypothetical protein